MVIPPQGKIPGFPPSADDGGRVLHNSTGTANMKWKYPGNNTREKEAG